MMPNTIRGLSSPAPQLPIALLFLAIGACSPNPQDPGYTILSRPTAGHLVGGPSSFMTSVGCTSATGHPTSGAVAIIMAVGKPAVFECDGVPKDSVNAARRRYHEAVSDSMGGVHLQSGYWDLDYVGSEEWCNVAGGAWGTDGYFHIASETQIQSCFWVDSYEQRWVSWGDPDYDPDEGGGGGGNTDSSSPPVGDPQPPGPVLNSLVLTPSAQTVSVGQVSGMFKVIASYSNGVDTTTVDLATLDPSIARKDDAGTFVGLAVGTATVSADIGVFHATATLTVAEECGSSSDPNVVSPDSTQFKPCAPSALDVLKYAGACVNGAVSGSQQVATDVCIAMKVDAYIAGCTICSNQSQSPECVQWLSRLVTGDISTLHLTQAQWVAITADTVGRTDSLVYNVTDSITGIHYETAKIWNWSTGSAYNYVLHKATIYYDSQGNPVALMDAYNMAYDPDKPLWVIAKGAVNAAAQGASFGVHYP
jgi:hypothetical protein